MGGGGEEEITFKFQINTVELLMRENASFKTTSSEAFACMCLCHCTLTRVQELCESRGGRPGLPLPESPYSLCGRKATLNSNNTCQSSRAV